MKPENVARLLQSKRIISEQEEAIDNLEHAAFESKVPNLETLDHQTRYRAAFDNVSAMCNTLGPDADEGYIEGKTPIITIVTALDGELVSLSLRLDVTKDIGEHSIDAIWAYEGADYGIYDVDRNNEGNFYIETVEKEASSLVSLANLEWSIHQYKEAISNLTSAELTGLGFSDDFINSQQLQGVH